MIPILQAPGVMIPGQLGPINREPFPAICAFTRIMSITGMPSVMQTTSSTPASTASRIESAAAGAGTKRTDTLHPVSRRASATVSNTGTLFSNFWPPLPGVTPATTLVPYSMHCRAWKPPTAPVIPCTQRRVFLSTNTDMGWEKFQAPGSKSQTSSNPQIQKRHRTRALNLGTWDFLGAWDLEFGISLLFPLVNQKLVPVRITELRHPTNRRFRLLHVERDAALFQRGDGRIDIVHLKRDRCAIARRIPSRPATNTDCGRAEIVFDPRAFHRGDARFQLKRFLIKFSSTLLVGDGD